MNMKLEVCISARTGLPYTRVSCDAMWDLVEYLSLHRTEVLFGYTEDGFTVTFQRMNQAAAQSLLDDWAKSEMPETAGQRSDQQEARELCFIPG